MSSSSSSSSPSSSSPSSSSDSSLTSSSSSNSSSNSSSSSFSPSRRSISSFNSCGRYDDARKVKKAGRNKSQGRLGRQLIAHPQVFILLSCAQKFHSRHIPRVPIIRNVSIPVLGSC
eukprot:g37909.t1